MVPIVGTGKIQPPLLSFLLRLAWDAAAMNLGFGSTHPGFVGKMQGRSVAGRPLMNSVH